MLLFCAGQYYRQTYLEIELTRNRCGTEDRIRHRRPESFRQLLWVPTPQILLFQEFSNTKVCAGLRSVEYRLHPRLFPNNIQPSKQMWELALPFQSFRQHYRAGSLQIQMLGTGFMMTDRSTAALESQSPYNSAKVNNNTMQARITSLGPFPTPVFPRSRDGKWSLDAY